MGVSPEYLLITAAAKYVGVCPNTLRHWGQSVVKILVEMIEPYSDATKKGGRVFDPCCGSGGMFVQSEKFVLAHGGRVGDIAVYGQESNFTTWRLAKMNLAIRGIDANLGSEPADSFHKDQHKDLKADFILANPPFNMSDWGGDRLREDARWKYGPPPVGNANYAWIQHFICHLAPRPRQAIQAPAVAKSKGENLPQPALEIARPLATGLPVDYAELLEDIKARIRAAQTLAVLGVNAEMVRLYWDTPCLENGKTAFVDFLADGQVGWGSTEYIVLRSKPPLPVEYAYFLARSEEFRSHAITNMTGTTGRQRVPATCLDLFNVVVPPRQIAERFGHFASSVIAVLKRHDEESRTLAAQRDALLPKLLSGEVSGNMVEKSAEELP